MLGTQASYGFCGQFVSKALDDSSSLESSFTLEQDMEEQDSRRDQDSHVHTLLSSVARMG